MKFGLNVINSWSEQENSRNAAGFIAELGVAAERAGWDGLFLWDHILFPWVVPVVDPWTVLGAIAGRTKNLRLGTTVTPLPRRRPHVVARQSTTLDHLTNGLFTLGVGLGSLDRDYEAFGEVFDHKLLAEKLDEALDIITRLWSGEAVTHHGRHYTVDDVTFLPKPIQKPLIPIWVGGKSEGALKRASRYDGWVVVGPAPAAGEEGVSLNRVSEARLKIMRYRGKNDPIDIAYVMDFPEEEHLLLKVIREAGIAGVTWMLEGIYGWRFDAEQALTRVEKGPPLNNVQVDPPAR